MDRRDLLRLSGAGVLAALAGCQDAVSEDDPTSTAATTRTPSVSTVDGPAQFRDVVVELPDEPTVGEPLPVRVAATNYGGEPGTFRDALVVDGPREAEWTVEISEIAPGHRGAVTFEPTWWLSGYYRFWLADRDLETGVRVRPRSGTVGETLTLEDRLAVTLEDVTFHSPVALFDGDEEFATALPAAGTAGEAILTAFHVAVENVGEEPVALNPGTFEVPLPGDRGRVYFQEGFDAPEWTYDDLAERRLDAERIVGTTVRPGTTRRGIVLGQVTYEHARGAVPFGVQRDLAHTPELEWTAPPDGDRRPLPRFEVDAVDVPDAPEIRSAVDYRIDVTNVGDRRGTFRGVLRYLRPDYTARALALLEEPLDPGASTTFTGTASFPYVREYDLELNPFGSIATVDAGPITQPFNDTFTTPSGVQLRVLRPIRSLEAQFGRDVNQLNINAEPNKAFISVGIEATLNDDASSNAVETIPGYDKFAVPSGENDLAHDIRVWAPNNGLSSINRDIKEHENRLEDPYEGPLWPENPADYIEGESLVGYIPFYVPREIDREEARVQLRLEKGDNQLTVSEWRYE